MKTISNVLFAILVTGLSGMLTPPSVRTYRFGHENVLGTSFDLKVMATTSDAAEEAEGIALTEIDRLNEILSSYKPESEFNRWLQTHNQKVPVSAELFEVLDLFDKWQTRTGGALSASAGTGVALWKKAESVQAVPAKEDLQQAAHAMNQRHWLLDPVAQAATHVSTEPLLLNSFVKSYIVGKVATKVMATPGISGCVVNIGGDMVVSGNLKERISISDPTADAENDEPLTTLTIGNNAIATSGSYRRGYAIGNQWYGHILDARTAVPVSDVISATVIAPNASDAGALATAFNILAPEESAALAKLVPGVAYQIVMRSGEIIESTGWPVLQTAAPDAISTKDAKNGSFEMTIELELARFEGRFRRPFVAVWIENGEKESVRTLALWYNKPRWLPDLKRWYSKNRENLYNTTSSVSSISSATRSPGRYTLKWDGLNDKGETLPPGKYTVYIEAAREHGTYQMLHQDFDWNGKAKHITLKGGVEITAASIDCHTLSDKQK